MKRSTAFMGTPGSVCSLVAAHGVLVVLDRQEDTWERTGEFKRGEERFAIQHEPTRTFKLLKHRNAAREEAARLSELGVRALAEERISWQQGG